MSVIVPHLSYPMDGLEPHISRRTVAAHYCSYHVACVNRVRALVDATPLETASIEAILDASQEMGKPLLFNAAAEAWNHSFYWACMDAAGGGEAVGPIAELIEAEFGSQSAFREQFVGTATMLVGSGWVWLVLGDNGLKIAATSNVSTWREAGGTPLLVLDLWEHAYYMDYQHRRSDYANAFISHLVSWDFANRNLTAARNWTTARRTRWSVVASAGVEGIPTRAQHC